MSWLGLIIVGWLAIAAVVAIGQHVLHKKGRLSDRLYAILYFLGLPWSLIVGLLSSRREAQEIRETFERYVGAQKRRSNPTGYYGSETFEPSPFLGTVRSHALGGQGPAHNETLIDFGPWSTGTGDKIIAALLAEKGKTCLADFTDEEFSRMFGRPKQQVIDAFLSGCIGTECYMIAMVLIAARLRRKHGELQEVRCSGPPNSIELVYSDGHTLAVPERSGHPDISLMSFGYSGTGPDCLYAFLREAGYRTSLEEIGSIRPPHTFRKPGRAGASHLPLPSNGADARE